MDTNSININTQEKDQLPINSENSTKTYFEQYLKRAVNSYYYDESHPNVDKIKQTVQLMKDTLSSYSGYFICATLTNGLLQSAYDNMSRNIKTTGELISSAKTTAKTTGENDNDDDSPANKMIASQTQLEQIMKDMLKEVKHHSTNCPKLFRDFNNLEKALRKYQTEKTQTESAQLIKELINLSPSKYSIGWFMCAFGNGHTTVIYNKMLQAIQPLRTLEQMTEEVMTEEVMTESDLVIKNEICRLFDELTNQGDEPMAIPNEKHEFMELWKQKKFDDRDPSTLLPELPMYRQRNYHHVDDWFVFHSSNLKHMSALKFWRVNSPIYGNLIELIHKTLIDDFPEAVEGIYRKYCKNCKLCENCEICEDCDECDKNVCFHCAPGQDEWNLTKRWDLTVPPQSQSQSQSQSLAKEYYNKTLTKFCEYAELSDNERTGNYLHKMYELSMRLHFMRECATHGLQYVVTNCQKLRVFKYWHKQTAFNDDDMVSDAEGSIAANSDPTTQSQRAYVDERASAQRSYDAVLDKLITYLQSQMNWQILMDSNEREATTKELINQIKEIEHSITLIIV